MGGSCLDDNGTNSLAASLAVAIAHELGRWDVTNDFMIINGKLEYSNTGLLMCGTSGVELPADYGAAAPARQRHRRHPNHDYVDYRNTLSGWYNAQKTNLDAMVGDMLYVDQGVYQIRSKNSGKLIAPQSGSSSSGAVIQQSDVYDASTASHWRVTLNGTKQQLKDVKSGLCLDLQTNTTAPPTWCRGAAARPPRRASCLAQQSASVLWIRNVCGGAHRRQCLQEQTARPSSSKRLASACTRTSASSPSALDRTVTC